MFMRATEYEIATPAESRLAMTDRIREVFVFVF
jgi:hypothetical protein